MLHVALICSGVTGMQWTVHVFGVSCNTTVELLDMILYHNPFNCNWYVIMYAINISKLVKSRATHKLNSHHLTGYICVSA